MPKEARGWVQRHSPLPPHFGLSIDAPHQLAFLPVSSFAPIWGNPTPPPIPHLFHKPFPISKLSLRGYGPSLCCLCCLCPLPGPSVALPVLGDRVDCGGGVLRRPPGPRALRCAHRTRVSCFSFAPFGWDEGLSSGQVTPTPAGGGGRGCVQLSSQQPAAIFPGW